MKIYAVRKGRKTGLFYSWDECKLSTTGFSGAEFKSFKSTEEANAYLAGEETLVNTMPEPPVYSEALAVQANETDQECDYSVPPWD